LSNKPWTGEGYTTFFFKTKKAAKRNRLLQKPIIHSPIKCKDFNPHKTVNQENYANRKIMPTQVCGY
jgi:hypothetical protein